jgi:hypothetical protein
MPRFFLHICGPGQGRSDDEFGLDFPDAETARSEVARAARDIEHMFSTQGQDPRDYAIEVENDTGEVVFRLPFSEILRLSLPPSHVTYKLIGLRGSWLIFCDDEFIGGFDQRALAEGLVREMVEARCAEQEASQVLIEDDLGCEKYLCRCFKEAPPGTPLS